MKKMILPALCLSLCLTSLNTSAANTTTAISVSISNDDRQAIKSEELPEGIKKTLATEEYKGWTVKEAAMVKNTATEANAAAGAEYYEVVLTNEKETKTVKFQKDGTLLK